MIHPQYADELLRRMVASAMTPVATDNRLSDEDYEGLRERLAPAIAEALRPIVAGQ